MRASSRAAAVVLLGMLMLGFRLPVPLARAGDTPADNLALLEGLGFFRLQRYDKAEESFSRLIRTNPKHAKAYLMRGLCRVLQSRHREALSDLNRAVVLEPKLADAYRGRGECYLFGLGDPSRASADLTTADLLEAGSPERLAEKDLEGRLRQWLGAGSQVTLVVAVPQFSDIDPLTLHALVRPAGSSPELRPRSYRAEVASPVVWRNVVELLRTHAPSLQEAQEWDVHDTPFFRSSRGVRVTFQLERPRELTVARGRKLKLSRRVLEHFCVVQAAVRGTNRTAIIISEAHNNLDEQLASLRGLEALLAENPWLKDRGEAAFLVEAWEADKPLSIKCLTDRSPKPSATLVESALATFLIPSYVAIEWKHRLGIPLIGHEDIRLYRLCNYLHWASHTGKWKGAEAARAANLMGASVAARNQSSGQTFVRSLRRYSCPILFIGHGHVGPYPWDREAKAILAENRAEARAERKEFEKLLPGEPMDWLTDVNRRSVASYLRDEGIGFVHLAPRPNPFLSDTLRRRHLDEYTALRKAQHDGAYGRVLAPYRSAAKGSCTTMPAPEALASILPALQTADLPDAGPSTSQERARALGDLLGGCGTVLGCFPSGTAVHTAGGPRPIETIRAGDKVWAADPVSGVWRLRPVTALLQGNYQGDFVTLVAGPGVLTATGSHPFWVRAGEDLAGRAPAGHVLDKGSVHGRWVNARDLRVGDVLVARDGSVAEVRALSRHIARKTVYTLRVEDHTFAVGASGLLVHNHCKYTPAGLDRSYRGGLRAALERECRDTGRPVPSRSEAHHLIPVGEAKKSEVMRVAAKEYGHNINRVSNGIWLANNAADARRRKQAYHDGPHKNYSAEVGRLLKDLDARYRASGRNWKSDKIDREIKKIENRMRRRVQDKSNWGKKVSRRATPPFLLLACG
jgi:hypothetical protein